MSALTAAAPLLVLLAAAGDAAMDMRKENPCITSWTGPSIDNIGHLNCTGDHLGEYVVSHVGPLLIPALIGIVALLCVGPCLCLFRAQCQALGGSKMRPGVWCGTGGIEWDERSEADRRREYSKCGIVMTKLGAFCVVLLVLAAVFLVYVGAGGLAVGFDHMVAGPKKAADWAIGEAETVIKALPDRFQLEQITTALADFRTRAGNLEKQFGLDRIMRKLETGIVVFAFLGAIPVLVTLAIALMGLCNCRRFVPGFGVGFSFVMIFGLGLVTTLLLAALQPARLVCGELEAQQNRQPGIFQWGLKPVCTKYNPLAMVQQQVVAVEATVAAEACQGMSALCSDASGIDDDAHPFTCGSTAASCATLKDVEAKMKAMVLRHPGLCTIPGKSATCTVQDCAAHCTDAAAKSAAAKVTSAQQAILQALGAISKVTGHFADCDKFFDRVIRFFPVCDLRNTLTLMVAGDLLCLVFFVFAVPVYFMASKRFMPLDPDSRGGEEAEELKEVDGVLAVPESGFGDVQAIPPQTCAPLPHEPSV